MCGNGYRIEHWLQQAAGGIDPEGAAIGGNRIIAAAVGTVLGDVAGLHRDSNYLVSLPQISAFASQGRFFDA